MLEALLQAFLLQGVLPEVLDLINKHFKDTGEIISLDELRTQFLSRADSVVTKGTDWLNSHQG